MNNRMNVQAFLSNVSFPKNIKDLDYYADQFDVEVLMCSEWVEWTVPKWTVPGDIVLFFHAKTAIQSIRRLETALKKEKEHLSQREYERLWKALQRARLLYQKYGGKILAIGKVAEQPFYDAHPGMSEEEELQLNINFITSRRIFAKIDEICLLPCPVDISEFSDFIFVSRQSAITPVVGSDFEHLKALLAAGNKLPLYLLESSAIPLPLQKINPENWLEVTQAYRRLFTLEIQFRRFYVDYFLRVLGDQKKFFSECACHRDGKRTGFADNAVKLGGKWCFVEIKLNVQAELHLHDQLKKYCHAEWADLREERVLRQERIWQNTMLVMDTTSLYCYDAATDRLDVLIQLDAIRTEEDIRILREELIPRLR